MLTLLTHGWGCLRARIAKKCGQNDEKPNKACPIFAVLREKISQTIRLPPFGIAIKTPFHANGDAPICDTDSSKNSTDCWRHWFEYSLPTRKRTLSPSRSVLNVASICTVGIGGLWKTLTPY